MDWRKNEDYSEIAKGQFIGINGIYRVQTMGTPCMGVKQIGEIDKRWENTKIPEKFIWSIILGDMSKNWWKFDEIMDMNDDMGYNQDQSIYRISIVERT